MLPFKSLCRLFLILSVAGVSPGAAPDLSLILTFDPSEASTSGKVAELVHELYSDSSEDVNSILAFGITLSIAELKFFVFDALSNEMRSTGYDDPLTFISLAKEMQILLSNLKDDEIMTKAKKSIEAIVDDVKALSIAKLQAAMIANKYQNNAEVEILTSALFDFREDVSSEVIAEVVDKVFGAISVERILENVSSHKHIKQAFDGLEAVFNILYSADSLDKDVSSTITSHIYKLQAREDYASLDSSLRDNLEAISQRLQVHSCASTLLSSKKVCLWNKGTNKFLYAADSLLKYNTNRRRVLMHSGDPKPGASWFVEKNGTSFLFNNAQYKDEYLYAAGIVYDQEMRNVFTWIPGNNTDEESLWSIEFGGEYCYLKSESYNEYLFASSLKYDDLHSHVFTSIIGTDTKSADFQWQLTDCD